MPLTGKKKDKRTNPIRLLIETLIVIVLIVYVVPAVKYEFFPDRMTRIEKMLKRSVFQDCTQQVERPDEFTIILTIEKSGAPMIKTEIYRDVARELEPNDDSRIFFSHSINKDTDAFFYLTRTHIIADDNLKRVKRLEVSICDQMTRLDGSVRYEDHEPIYECRVPDKKIVCFTQAPNKKLTN